MKWCSYAIFVSIDIPVGINVTYEDFFFSTNYDFMERFKNNSGNGDSKGWGKLPEISEKKNRFGLGYESSKATLKGKARFPPIQETFISKGVEHGEQVAMMSHKDNIIRALYFIHECPQEKS